MSRGLTPPELVNTAEWLLWIVSWLLVAMWSDRAVARASNQLGYRVLNVVGAVLLFWYHSRAMLWSIPRAVGWTADAIAAVGFLFTWWARIHLGKLWSSQVTRKAHHPIVDTGPYGIVRHPIYTGLSLATIATMALHGTPAGVAGGLLLIAGYYAKARVEERFLHEQLGTAAYDAYARRVPMLIPSFRHG